MQKEADAMTSCRLCSDFSHDGSVKAWNEPLFESQNFIVLPSLGAMVEGWVLLVPKMHFICMGALPDSIATEMHEMKQFLSTILKEIYGQVCIFEHGPSKANQSIGCGVDHAHLHVVPVAFDLYSAIASFLPKGVLWSEAGLEECQTAFSRGEDYLYIEKPIGAGHLATHQGFGSQLIRRAIANQVGIPNQFNWREYPQLPKVSATIEKLRAWGGSSFVSMNRLEVAA